MGTTDKIRTSDVRALLRLVTALHAASDPLARKRRMVEGLCELTGADCGIVAVTQTEPSSQKLKLVSLVENCTGSAITGSATIAFPIGPADSSVFPELLASPSLSLAELMAGQAPATSRGGRRPTHPRRQLVSSRPLHDEHTTANIYLFRRSPQSRPFERRHQAMVHLFHQEVCWVYQPDVLLLSPGAKRLSPRERQTLELLLAGQSEKQISARLRLSPNTVHHYVKSIHRRFDVSSRSELLARWTGMAGGSSRS